MSRSPRWTAIVVWSSVILIFIAYFFTFLRLDFTQMLVPCEGAGCNSLALSTAEITALTSWGLSMPAYAYFMSTVTVFVTVVYWALGGLIAWRQGSNPVGLAVSLSLIVIPISTYGGSTDWATNYPNLVVPGIFLNIFGTFIMLVFFYLIPNGRFSPRWAYIPLTLTLFLVTLLTLQINRFIALPDEAQSLLGATTVAFVIFGGILQVYRYRRDSTPSERQQIKWILSGLLTYVLSVIVWVLIFGRALEIPAGKWRLLAMLGGGFFQIFTLLSLPAAITIAILRYRLWDIDLVIRRTLQYALLTGLLALAYFGGVVLLQGVVGPLSGQANSPLVAVLTTLGVAALFNPLRKRTQDFIDRRFFRQKYDAEKALAEFAAAARQETDLTQLTHQLTKTVQETIQPTETSVWLRK